MKIADVKQMLGAILCSATLAGCPVSAGQSCSEYGLTLCEGKTLLTCSDGEGGYYWSATDCSVCVTAASGDSFCAVSATPSDLCKDRSADLPYTCDSNNVLVQCHEGYEIERSQCDASATCVSTETPEFPVGYFNAFCGTEEPRCENNFVTFCVGSQLGHCGAPGYLRVDHRFECSLLGGAGRPICLDDSTISEAYCVPPETNPKCAPAPSKSSHCDGTVEVDCWDGYEVGRSDCEDEEPIYCLCAPS